MTMNPEESPKSPRSRLRRLVVLVSVVSLGLAVFLLFPGPDDEPELVAVTGLSMPDRIAAGTIASIDVRSEVDAGNAEIVVQNAFGRLQFIVPIVSGVGTLDLPPAVTQQAGIITVSASDTQARLTVDPVDVAEVVAPLVGPRTIVADGRDTTLAVILPVDRYGNQVADGTTVDIEWEQPVRSGTPNNTTAVTLETENGMTYSLIPSGEIAGPTTVRATATTSAGQLVNAAAVRIDEVPGRVESIELVAVDEDGSADGRSLVEVETDILFDAFDNQLMDGTLGQFVFDGPAGQGVVPGTVQNGVVRIEIVAPDKPGTLVGFVEIQGERSNEVQIEFASAIASFDARIEQVGADAVLRIDSVLDPEGAFVADGTEVRWGEHNTQIRQGAAEIWLPAALVPEELPLVEILGLEKTPEGTVS